MWANHNQNNIAFIQCLADNVLIIEARLDEIYIHKYIVVWKMLFQVVT